MTSLASVMEQYQAEFLKEYGHRLLSSQKKALRDIISCRTPAAGIALLKCTGCGRRDMQPMSCGHRSCPGCQHFQGTQWLERQRKKLLPVDYFMVTFTLPAQLRSLAWWHQRKVYAILFEAASSTLKQFGSHPQGLDASLGMTGVLHTHNRREDYHPHIHFIVPGGGVNKRRREWRKVKGNYLFKQENLATVFRARVLRGLNEARLLSVDDLPASLPKKWVVDCKHVGKGEPALKYLSRYLYRGTLSERNIVANKDGQVTFSFIDSKTGKVAHRTLLGKDFLWLILKHVLPIGFRRVRDYGFLHGNARATLLLVQLVLQVKVPEPVELERPTWSCRHCGEPMKVIAFKFLRPG
ncbi:MAG: IS91 family transposase [Endozoicomonas sp.]